MIGLQQRTRSARGVRAAGSRRPHRRRPDGHGCGRHHHMMRGLRVVVTADLDIERACDSYRIGRVEGEVVVAGHAPRRRTLPWRPARLVAVRDYRIVTDMRSIDVMLESTGVPGDRRGRGAALGAQRP